MKKNKMSLEDHKRTGAELNEMQRYFTHLSVVLSNSSKLTAKHVRLANAIDKKLLELRSELENQMFKDFGDKGSIKIYFGRKYGR